MARSRDRVRLPLILAALLLFAACEEGPGSEADDDPPEAPASEPLSDDPLEAAIQKTARKRTRYMQPEGDFRRGSLEQGETMDLALVLKDPHCYAAFAQGGPDVEDLDLFLYDPANVPVQQDSATNPHPTLGLSDPVCPAEPGVYRLQVKVHRGHGEFALRLYRSE
ncbi:MAG: hypothetical protein ACOCXM_04115 [Myxococcota bacterium]